MEYFAILGFARSGTTWLSGSLGSHPHIASGGEIFNNTNPYWNKWKIDGTNPDYYLDHMIDIGMERGNITDKTKMCGFKVLYYHARQEVDVNDISKKLKIIHLKRRRHLMSITSNMMVENSKNANVERPYQNEYIDQKVCFTPKELKNIHLKFKHREKDWDYFDDAFKNYEKIEVWYEDMCQNPEREHKRILEFLGMKQMPLRGRTTKQRTMLLRDSINYDEASQHLIKAL